MLCLWIEEWHFYQCKFNNILWRHWHLYLAHPFAVTSHNQKGIDHSMSMDTLLDDKKAGMPDKNLTVDLNNYGVKTKANQQQAALSCLIWKMTLKEICTFFRTLFAVLQDSKHWSSYFYITMLRNQCSFEWLSKSLLFIPTTPFRPRIKCLTFAYSCKAMIHLNWILKM